MRHRQTILVGVVGVLAACGGPRAAVAPVPEPAHAVRPGIEVLLSDSLSVVRHARVGLVTNQAGVDAAGVSDVDRLRAGGLELVALYSPEHGYRGAADPGAAVPHATDSVTGLPIYSLYLQNTAAISATLAGLDVLLVDLQDVGARYYTYFGTTVAVMRAAVLSGKRVVVLDRPNPIGGTVQGNVLDSAYSSLVGVLPIPMRHGMTLGELARLANAELRIGADLTVVPVMGWSPAMDLDQTGLPFVPPSPNLRSLEALFHYPGLCLFEGTNLSVGRGTDHAFEQVGAPWMDTTKVLARLRAAHLPGVRFAGVRFRPKKPGDAKYPNTRVAGIRLTVTDRAAYDPTATAVTMMAVIRDVHPAQFKWTPGQFDRLAGNSELRQDLAGGAAPEAAMAGWPAELQAFALRSQAALLYPRSARLPASPLPRP
ncbi:MAG TPA: DUF1343 domain-containing protein [Gemmatimonadales bacterium]|nr:DUF1343 domain-containing protein [Gemmatimonadales bacterium]